MIIFKVLLALVLALIAITGIYFILGLTIPYIPFRRNTNDLTGPNFETIYLKSDGLHSDIVIPVNNLAFDWRNFLNPNDFSSHLDPNGYLAFGWGDKGFFLEIPEWKDLTFKIAFKAMCIPSPTVMHVIHMDEPPAEFKYFRAIEVSQAQYQILLEYLLSYFKMDKNRNILIRGLGYTDNDNFYESTRPYHALITCNEWVNRALKVMGIKTAIWSPGGFGLFLHKDENENYSLSRTN